MVMGSETEKRANGETVIYRYYLCPACNYRLLDEKIMIRRTGELLEIRIEVNGGPSLALSRETLRRRVARATKAVRRR
jgi:C4-type Zn-finger protein